MSKIVLFHCLAFYICPWFVLVSSRLLFSARTLDASAHKAWIEGKLIWNNGWLCLHPNHDGKCVPGLCFLLLVITCVTKLRKGSSAALWSQCSSFVLQWRFKNIRIILLLLSFVLLIFLCILIRPSMCFLLQLFSFILLV